MMTCIKNRIFYTDQFNVIRKLHFLYTLDKHVKIILFSYHVMNKADG